MNCILFSTMDKVFSLKKTLKILENGNKYWKSQGSLSIQKSENHGEGNVFTPVGHSDSGGVYGVTSCLAAWSHVPSGRVSILGGEGLHPEWGMVLPPPHADI